MSLKANEPPFKQQQMNHIKSIKELAKILDEVKPNEHPKVMKRIKIAAEDIEQNATWSEGCYTRNCLARTNDYELILLCWDIGAQSPIHGHDGKDCWMFQIKGSVDELRFNKEPNGFKETNRTTLFQGGLSYMCDRMGYHTIMNNSNKRAMTLHIYASPIDSCKVYNDQDECFEIKEMSYDTFKGKKVEELVS